MKIAIGSDHAGFHLKERLKGHLGRRGIEVTDFGAGGTASVDYPDFAFAVACAVSAGEYDRGVLVCSTGIGMCVAANKVKGIRAALGYDADAAVQSRAHVDCNVLVFGQNHTDADTAAVITDRWLETPFEGGRHDRRVKKITAFEQDRSC